MTKNTAIKVSETTLEQIEVNCDYQNPCPTWNDLAEAVEVFDPNLAKKTTEYEVALKLRITFFCNT